jgi:hypothetical protein
VTKGLPEIAIYGKAMLGKRLLFDQQRLDRLRN